MLKRTRYYIANRARVNEAQQGASELSSRFFEGAAAGTIMLGEVPDTDDFKNNFDWPDVVIPIAFDCPHIGDVIDELNQQPERLATIRRTNVTQALHRHDSVHRLQQIFTALGLAPTPKMTQREAQLQQIAQSYQQAEFYPA